MINIFIRILNSDFPTWFKKSNELLQMIFGFGIHDSIHVIMWINSHGLSHKSNHGLIFSYTWFDSFYLLTRFIHMFSKIKNVIFHYFCVFFQLRIKLFSLYFFFIKSKNLVSGFFCWNIHLLSQMP